MSNNRPVYFSLPFSLFKYFVIWPSSAEVQKNSATRQFWPFIDFIYVFPGLFLFVSLRPRHKLKSSVCLHLSTAIGQRPKADLSLGKDHRSIPSWQSHSMPKMIKMSLITLTLCISAQPLWCVLVYYDHILRYSTDLDSLCDSRKLWTELMTCIGWRSFIVN